MMPVVKNETQSIVKANVGDTIIIQTGDEKGKEGEVVVKRENSVVVVIGRNQKRDEPIKTVVNHKHYQIVNH